MTAAYDPHPDWELEDERDRRRQLLRRIPDYNTPDTDPFADNWQEAS